VKIINSNEEAKDYYYQQILKLDKNIVKNYYKEIKKYYDQDGKIPENLTSYYVSDEILLNFSWAVFKEHDLDFEPLYDMICSVSYTSSKKEKFNTDLLKLKVFFKEYKKLIKIFERKKGGMN